MKTKMILLLVLTSKTIYGQDTIRQEPRHRQQFFSTEKRTHVFSVSPMSRKTAKVDGLVLGFGHIDNKLVENQTINGLNVEVNPAPGVGALLGFMALMYLPEMLSNQRKARVSDTLNTIKKPDFLIPKWEKNPYLKLNGVNISSGCFFTNTSMNGLNISLANKFKDFNGLSITPLATIAENQNGMSIGLINAQNDLNGLAVGVYNQSVKLDGVQFGLINQSITNHGIQIGFFNRSYSKGFQLGVWNKNAKRSLPILNW